VVNLAKAAKGDGVAIFPRERFLRRAKRAETRAGTVAV